MPQKDDKTPVLPPFDEDAEEQVLCAILIENDALIQARQLLHPHDFYKDVYRKIFEAMCIIGDHANGNGPLIDLHTLKDVLEQQGLFEHIGGYLRLATLQDHAFSAANISYHAKRVHDLALIRNFGNLGYELERDSHDLNTTPDLLRQKVQGYLDTLNETPCPSWAFWREVHDKYTSRLEIDTLKYLEFLSTQLSYRTFIKCGSPCIVSETFDGFEYCVQRNTQIVSLKQEVIDCLIQSGWRKIASELLLKPRLFSLDVLENLPEISREKVQQSIFAQGKTRVKLQDAYVGGEPVWTYLHHESERVLLRRHDIGIIVAKTGKGKTTSLELLISQALQWDCEPESPFRLNLEPDEIIVHIDSEQTHDDNLGMLRRIAKRTHARANNLLNEEGEFRNYILEMCADDVEDTNLWILEKLESIKENIGLVIDDTLLDSTDDMNDQRLSYQFFRDMKRVARVKNCAILFTCHASDNSTDDDGKPMGHLGSLFARRSKVVLQVRPAEEDKDIKIIGTDFKKAKTRGAKDYGLCAAFKHDEDGIAHFIAYTPPEPDTKRVKKASDVLKNFKSVLGDKALTKEKLRTNYKQICECSDKSFYRDFKQAQKLGIIRNISGYISISPEKL